MNYVNNNKRDINSYLNENDLARYLSFLQFENPYLFKESEITNIDDLFKGNNTLAIILINDTSPDGIGHFVILRKDDESFVDEGSGQMTKTKYTYFDCLCKPMTPHLKSLFEHMNGRSHIDFLTGPSLMGIKNNICGKYVISFALAGNIKVQDYYNLLTASPKYSADQLVNNLIRINYTDNQLKNNYF